MKRVLSFLASIALAGCATTQSAQQDYVAACSAYNAAFSTALTLRQQGKLTPAQVQAVSDLDAQATPLCTGALPSDPTVATQQITAAATTLTAEVIVQKVSK